MSVDFGAAAGDDAGVGHEQVNRPDVGFYGLDQGTDIIRERNIGPNRHPADLVGNRLSACQIAVRADDGLRPFSRKAPRHRRSDPAGAAGDNDDLVCQIHFDPVPLE